MLLRTLGGLALEDSAFARPMRLLLLAYLAIEGPTPRASINELFAADLASSEPADPKQLAEEHARNLTTALGQIRREAAPDLIVRSKGVVEVAVRCDALEFEAALDAGDLERAVDLYRGHFLLGAEQLRYMRPERWDPDLSAWVRDMRRRLAGRAVGALVRLGQTHARMGDVERAIALGERAHIAFAAAFEDDDYAPGRSCFAPSDLQVLDGLLGLAPGDGGARFRALAAAYDGLDLPVDARSAVESHLGADHALTERPRGEVVGRRRDLATVSGLLDRGRGGFVTVVGTGGIGKTTLARQLAWQRGAEGRYPDGVHVVSLEDVRFANLVPVRVAAAVGATLEPPGDALDQLIAYLRTRRALLVLDNFEHLLERRDVPARLASECPDLDVVVTSRERLGRPGEAVHRLEGLAVEDAAHIDVDADAGDGGAVAWFVRAARTRATGRAFGPDDLPAITRLCQFLEGHPLAIELAARLGDVMPLGALEDRLRVDASMLDVASDEHAERGRSLRTVWESAWTGLDAADRGPLSALAVFHGGFTWEAANEVAGADVGRLRRWRERSLLHAGDEQRLHVHPTLKAFLLAKLRDSGVQEHAAGRHRAYFLRCASDHAARLRGSQARDALAFFALEHANLRAAWESTDDAKALAAFARVLAVAHARLGDLDGRMALLERAKGAAERAGRRDDVAELANAIADVRLQRGEVDEAFEVLQVALANGDALDGRDDLLAETFSQLGGVHYLRREHDEAIGHFERSRALHEARGDRGLAAAELGNVAAVHFQRGDFAEAVRIWKRALTGHRRAGDLELQALALNNLGAAHQALGEFDAAMVCLEKAVALLDTLGDASGAVSARVNIGAIAFVQGAYDRSRALNEQALAAYRGVGDALGAALARTNLAMLDEREGSFESAHEELSDVLALQERFDERVHRVATLYNLSTVSLRLGRVARAATLAREAIELAKETDHPVGAAYAYVFLADAEAAGGAVAAAEAAYDAAERGFAEVSDVVGVLTVAVRRAALAARRADHTDAATMARDARERALRHDLLPLAFEAAELELAALRASGDHTAVNVVEAHVSTLAERIGERARRI